MLTRDKLRSSWICALADKAVFGAWLDDRAHRPMLAAHHRVPPAADVRSDRASRHLDRSRAGFRGAADPGGIASRPPGQHRARPGHVPPLVTVVLRRIAAGEAY